MTHDLWKRDAAMPSPTNPQQTCPQCLGLGTIPKAIKDSHGVVQAKAISCPRCHGTGTVQPETPQDGLARLLKDQLGIEIEPEQGAQDGGASNNGLAEPDQCYRCGCAPCQCGAEPEAGSEVDRIVERVAAAHYEAKQEFEATCPCPSCRLKAARGITESDQPRSSDGPAATPSSTSKSEELEPNSIGLEDIEQLLTSRVQAQLNDPNWLKDILLYIQRVKKAEADRRVREALEHLREISRPYPTTSKGELYNLIDSTLAQLDKQEDTQ